MRVSCNLHILLEKRENCKELRDLSKRLIKLNARGKITEKWEQKRNVQQEIIFENTGLIARSRGQKRSKYKENEFARKRGKGRAPSERTERSVEERNMVLVAFLQPSTAKKSIFIGQCLRDPTSLKNGILFELWPKMLRETKIALHLHMFPWVVQTNMIFVPSPNTLF